MPLKKLRESPKKTHITHGCRQNAPDTIGCLRPPKVSRRLLKLAHLDKADRASGSPVQISSVHYRPSQSSILISRIFHATVLGAKRAATGNK